MVRPAEIIGNGYATNSILRASLPVLLTVEEIPCKVKLVDLGLVFILLQVFAKNKRAGKIYYDSLS